MAPPHLFLNEKQKQGFCDAVREILSFCPRYNQLTALGEIYGSWFGTKNKRLKDIRKKNKRLKDIRIKNKRLKAIRIKNKILPNGRKNR